MTPVDVHNQDSLRQVVDRLLASGDLDITSDGAVRPDRVNAARDNLGNGTYDRREVISGIVDRLLEQWRI